MQTKDTFLDCDALCALCSATARTRYGNRGQDTTIYKGVSLIYDSDFFPSSNKIEIYRTAY